MWELSQPPSWCWAITFDPHKHLFQFDIHIKNSFKKRDLNDPISILTVQLINPWVTVAIGLDERGPCANVMPHVQVCPWDRCLDWGLSMQSRWVLSYLKRWNQIVWKGPIIYVQASVLLHTVFFLFLKKRREQDLLWIIVVLNEFGSSFRQDMTCQVWRRQDQRRQTVLV